MVSPNGRVSMPNSGGDSRISPAAPHKQIVLILASLVIIALAAGAYFLLRHPSPSQLSRAFLGTIERVEGNTVIARGTFLADGVQVSRNKQSDGDEVRITITSSTVLTRIAWQLPEGVPGATSSLAWDAADLKQERSQGSLTELADMENVPISVTSDQNILYLDQFQAKTLDYLTTSFYKPKDKIPQ